ncbi:hypothetical protein [Schumannella soli]|uniref:Uncharacterized protein n=1 Tax=Schumannella soli TaxID=2590779 RepID=A0A506XU16_9MICO|nr:hypothetical protein [Schumannella soli]TPW76201.1 hypothetical protein FJ657_10405 [Schumannella soli]
MRRPLVTVIAAVVTGALLSGCVATATSSHRSASPSSSPTASGGVAIAGGGGIEYAGGAGGTVAWTTAACTVANGRLTAMTTPDPRQSTDAPSLSYAITDGDGARFALPDGRVFSRGGTLDGVVAGEHRGVWSIAFASTELDDPAGGAAVTVSGTITCSRVAG